MTRKKSLLAIVLALIASFILWVVVPSGAQAVAPAGEEPIVKLTDAQKKEKAEKGFLAPTAEEVKARKEALKDWKKHSKVREPGPDDPIGGKGKALGSRKATKADVDSGFASTLAATVYLCTGTANLKSPESQNLVRSNYLKLGWEETESSGGRPMARVNTGNAIFVVNIGARAIYWSAAQWENTLNSAAPLYEWTRWAYNQTAYNVIAPNGGQLGMKVLSNGYTDQGSPGSTWYNQEYAGAGWRTGITNYGDDSLPDMNIYLWGSGSYANSGSHSEVFVEATNSSPCGYLHSFDY